MWVKKTEEELSKEKDKPFKFSFKAPLILGFTFLFITIFADLIGQSAISTWKPKSIIGIISNPKKYLTWSIGSFLVISIYQFWNKKNLFQEKNNVQICDKCHKIKNRDDGLDCKCGGKFLQIEKMKWIEGKS